MTVQNVCKREDSVSSCEVKLLPRTYSDETDNHGRTLRLVFYASRYKWHIKVTLEGVLSRTSKISGRQRREDFKEFCTCIDFGSIELLHDTVTEIVVTRVHDAHDKQERRLELKTWPNKESEYAAVADELCFYVREDPSRVWFPVYGHPDGLVRDISEVKVIRNLAAGTHEVLVNGEEQSYVYKEIDRPLYEPRDSEVLEQELRNLRCLRDVPGIVQLVAAVTSDNPYRTADTAVSGPVLRGILVQFHPNGTLGDALSAAERHFPWLKWARQITRAISRLHEFGITHMDLKPANIVISESLEGIVIDVSGIGGTTRQWLSHEMLIIQEPLRQGIESRIKNDIWALGKILLEMAEATCDRTHRKLLKETALQATADAHVRISLEQIIFNLSKTPNPQ